MTIPSLEKRLEKAILSGLSACIGDHGPITYRFLSSAYKRIIVKIREEVGDLSPEQLLNLVQQEYIWIITKDVKSMKQQINGQRHHIKALEKKLRRLGGELDES